jgi:hypothetical protein
MITGRPAFQGASRLSTLSAVLREEPPPPGAETPRDLEKILTRCLRKDPDRRHQHMDEVKLALLEVKEETESGAAAPAPALERRQRRYLWWAAGAVVVLLALGAVAWFGFLRPPAAAASSVMVSSVLSAAYASAGRRSEAQKLFSQLQEASRARYLSPYLQAGFHLALGDKDRSLALLAQAVDDREPYLFWLPAIPGFDPLRSDPRFEALLRKMKLKGKSP